MTKRHAGAMSPPGIQEAPAKKRRSCHKRLHIKAFSDSIGSPPNGDKQVDYSVSNPEDTSESPFDLADVVTPSQDFALLDSNVLWAFPTPLPTPNESLDFPSAQIYEWPQLQTAVPPLVTTQPESPYILSAEPENDVLYSPTLANPSLPSSDNDISPYSHPQTTPPTSTTTDSFSGQSTLHLAAKRGHLNIVSLLLSRGSEVNDTDILGQSALHLAASNNYPAVIDLLISKGAIVYLKDLCGRTALHLAAANGCVDVVKILIEFIAEGSEVGQDDGRDAVDTMGRTPLHLAIEGGWEEVVAVLLDSGADPAAKIVRNWTVGQELGDGEE